jgi:hypothetical protein
MPGSEIGRGYLKGLEGLLLTVKSNDDKYLYLAKMEMTEKKLRTLRKEFADHRKNTLHTDYDRGYFQALESYMRKLESSEVTQETATPEKNAKA